MKYILNPGDGHDVETADGPGHFGHYNGTLYRVDSYGCLETYDRSTGQWYEADRTNTQIKVLRAAGLHK